MKQTPIYVCLFLFYVLLFSTCSKELIVDELEGERKVNIEIPIEHQPIKQYIDAQAAMLQLLTTVMTETVRSAVLPPILNISPPACVEYIDSSGMPGRQTIDIKISFGDNVNTCDPGNGHSVQGVLYIQSFADSIFQTQFDTVPAFIRFQNNQISINDYTFELVKENPSEGGQDLKFYNGGSVSSPIYEFALSDKTYFRLTDSAGDSITIFPTYSPNPYLKIIPTDDITSLNYLDLYDNTYDVKFEADPLAPITDNFWEVKSYSAGMVDLLRVITPNEKNLIITPVYPWPLNGGIRCYNAPSSSGGFPVLELDLDFGSDINGCNNGNMDEYIEVCTYENAGIDCFNTDCQIWDFSF